MHEIDEKYLDEKASVFRWFQGDKCNALVWYEDNIKKNTHIRKYELTFPFGSHIYVMTGSGNDKVRIFEVTENTIGSKTIRASRVDREEIKLDKSKLSNIVSRELATLPPDLNQFFESEIQKLD